MKRIGVAFSGPDTTVYNGKETRRNEYGIYRSEAGHLYAQYEGHRKSSPTGEVQVGLPMAGPNNAWTQVKFVFVERDYTVIRYF